MNILIIRPDALGDAVLSSSMLPLLKKKYPNANIFLVCQNSIGSLYENCPYLTGVIRFDKKEFVANRIYKKELLKRLKNLAIDLAINSVFSRELSMDCLATQIGAARSVAFKITERRGKYDFIFRYNYGYTDLVQAQPGWQLELSRHQEMLHYLGIETERLQPCIWLGSQDEKYADDFFKEHIQKGQIVIGLFAGALSEYRKYVDYGNAISAAFGMHNGVVVLAFGASCDDDIIKKNLEDIPYKKINLCGNTTILQAAALLKRCSWGIGAETGLAHIACAVGLRHIIVLGGGHIGRFMPYSSLTASVVLPLACYGCNWRCPYKTVHCVKDIEKVTFIKAIQFEREHAIGLKPRIFMQRNFKTGYGRPLWKQADSFLPNTEKIFI